MSSWKWSRIIDLIRLAGSDVFYTSNLKSDVLAQDPLWIASTSSLTSSPSFQLPTTFQHPVIPSVGNYTVGDAIDPWSPTDMPPILNSHDGLERCSDTLAQHAFAFSYGQPFVGNYSLALKCNKKPWKHVVLEWETTCKGLQFDRIAAVWIGGLEVLRTSTQEPNQRGIHWRFQKDVTSSIPFLQGNQDMKVVVALDNLVNEHYTGIFNVTLKAHVIYKSVQDDDTTSGFSRPPATKSKLGLADVIYPLSASNDSYGYFRIEPDTPLAQVPLTDLPRNIKRAEVEVFLSHHQRDEFWYTNTEPHAFKEVFVLIDDMYAGYIMPFPLVFTGGITPYLWRPIVGIGALDAPSYTIDVTPFIPLLVDGQNHTISFGVDYGLDVWLISGHLKVWLDHASTQTRGEMRITLEEPLELFIDRQQDQDCGSVETRAYRSFLSSALLETSEGKFLTEFRQVYDFKNYQYLFNQSNNVEFTQDAFGKDISTLKSVDKGLSFDYDYIKTRLFDYPISGSIYFIPFSEPNSFSINSTIQHEWHQEHWETTGTKITTLLKKQVKSQRGSAYLNRSNGTSMGYGLMTHLFKHSGRLGCYHQKLGAKAPFLVENTYSFDCLDVQDKSLWELDERKEQWMVQP